MPNPPHPKRPVDEQHPLNALVKTHLITRNKTGFTNANLLALIPEELPHKIEEQGLACNEAEPRKRLRPIRAELVQTPWSVNTYLDNF